MPQGGRKTFASHLWASFRNVHGWVITGIGAVATIGTWLGLPDQSVPAPLVALAGFAAFLVLAVLGDLASEGVSYLNRRMPKARYGASPPPLYRGAVALVVLDPSDLFGHESVVSIYRQNGPIEQLLGIGIVATIQENGRVQVIVTAAHGDDDFWDRIRDNQPDAIDAVLVKPSIPRLAFENYDRQLLPRIDESND